MFSNAGRDISGFNEGYSKFLRPGTKGTKDSFNQSEDDAFENF